MKSYALKGNGNEDVFVHLRKGLKPHCGPCRNPLTCGCQYTILPEHMQRLAKEQGYE